MPYKTYLNHTVVTCQHKHCALELMHTHAHLIFKVKISPDSGTITVTTKQDVKHVSHVTFAQKILSPLLKIVLTRNH